VQRTTIGLGAHDRSSDMTTEPLKPDEQPDADPDPLDETNEQSFPSSDPPSTWAGEDHPRQ
jgi:hypothetical protein